MISACIFDWDGTIIDWKRRSWIPYMVDAACSVLDNERIRQPVEAFMQSTVGKSTCEQIRTIIEMFGASREHGDEIRRLYDLSLHISGLEQIKELGKDGLIMPHVEEVFSFLRDKNIPIYVVSGANQQTVEEYADLLDLRHYFVGIFGLDKNASIYDTQPTKEHIVWRIRDSYQQDALILGFGDLVEDMKIYGRCNIFPIGIHKHPPSKEMIKCAALIWEDFKDVVYVIESDLFKRMTSKFGTHQPSTTNTPAQIPMKIGTFPRPISVRSVSL